MGQSTEEIEAKLAAYVDGALDDAGRAEIEKHLAANPQHKRLLDDLSQHRDLLRALPSEKAPPEILESMHAHLERRLLLEEDAAVAGRIGPSVWRNFMSIAAVLLLAGTLGLLIYSVVPSSKVGSPELAHLERSDAPARAIAPDDSRIVTGGVAAAPIDMAPPTGAGTTALADAASRAAIDALSPDATGDTFAATGAAGGSISVPGALATGSSPEPRLDRPSVGPIGLDRESVTASATPVLLLLAEDPAVAEREVSSVLNQNGVAFQQVAAASTSRAIPPRDEIGGMFGRTATATSPSQDGEAVAGRERRVAEEESAASSRRLADSALANAGAAVQNAQNESIFLVPKMSRAQFQVINDALSRQTRAKQQHVPAEAQQQYKSFAQAQSVLMTESNLAIKEKFANEKKAEVDSGRVEPGKLELGKVDDGKVLNGAVSNEPVAQPAAPKEVDAVIASGDQLSIDNAAVRLGSARQQTVTVSPEGKLAIPELPDSAPIPAAGMTVKQLEAAVNDKLRENAKDADAQVTITRQDEPLTDVVIVVRGGAIGGAEVIGGGAVEAAPEVPAPAATTPGLAPTTIPATPPPSVSPTTAPATQPN